MQGDFGQNLGMPISPSLRHEFDHELISLRRCLERLPEDQFDYKPHPKSMTLRQLATHLAQMPIWGATTIQTPEFDMSQPFEQPNPQTVAEVLAILDSGATTFQAALDGASDEDLAVTWKLIGKGGAVFLEMPRLAVLRGMVLNHMIHHRGQLSVYLRLLDVAVPSMYGPTADESRS